MLVGLTPAMSLLMGRLGPDEGNFIYTAYISLGPLLGEKGGITKLEQQLNADLENSNTKSTTEHHQSTMYLAGFSQKFNFMVDLEKNEIRTGGEKFLGFAEEEFEGYARLAKKTLPTDRDVLSRSRKEIQIH
ncbi:hypothetical protein AVEN_25266-1 [Araneus ventricosus]|uniref:Uncharacterized protein n=1 Tax=Araneus ventricosus TaxID=182803 RepID=A0A4Y2VCU2_ARAVE|nr:hypothetical protein AVEN_25266-1 [Araneus ventricosus]